MARKVAIDVEHAQGGRLLYNFLVADEDNAKEVWEASEGYGVLGIVLKDYPSLDQAMEICLKIKELTGMVSIGLGGGDSSQWRRVVDLALRLNPGHLNQVFPAVGYTIGALETRGIAQDNVVNALISPSGTPGIVVVSTGPVSEKASEPARVPVDTAIKMVSDVGGKSIKLFPIGGTKKLPEVIAVAKSTKEAGLPVLEPTGGITPDNVGELLEACLEFGPPLIIPHVHSSVIDPATGRTVPELVRRVVLAGKRCLGIA